MVLQQIFCRFTASVAQTHCARGPQLVNKKFLEEEIFTGTNFRKLAFDHQNRENFCLVKISHYTGCCKDSAKPCMYLYLENKNSTQPI